MAGRADRMRGLIAIAVVAAGILGPRPAAAQEDLIERLKLDRLQLVSLGLGAGSIAPAQVERTTVYVLNADYGEFSPAWRIHFRISYWESQMRGSVVNAFADTLQANLADPSATSVVPSQIRLYDAAFAFGARRILDPRADVTPFFTVGIAGHVINAEGRLIKGTFVERALDQIAAGGFVDAGVQFRILRRVLVETSVRGDLVSGFRSRQWVAIGSYYFGEPRKEGER